MSPPREFTVAFSVKATAVAKEMFPPVVTTVPATLTAPTPVSYLRLKPHHWSSSDASIG